MVTLNQILCERTNAPITNDELDEFADRIKSKYKLNRFSLVLIPNSRSIGLMLMVVDKDQQGGGSGSKAMEELCSFADKHKMRITLSPMGKDARTGTTSKSRLVEFYKRFGFYENKGRKRDFTTMEDMIRDPK